MTARTWVYGQLTTFEALVALIGGTDPRVFAKKAMTSNIEDTPYLVYKLGFSANEDIAEHMPDGSIVSRQFLQVWVHDYSDNDTGDYMRIDAVIKQVIAALHGGSSVADGVIYSKFLEISQDLNDETLNTVVKYVRFQLTLKE